MRRRLALALALVAALAPTGLAASRPAATGDGRGVTVSFTFDDGLASQLTAARLLATHNVRGTFFINSDRVGSTGRLSAEQLRTMAGAGHEIGGHTLDHLNVASVDPDEQRRQVCDDRVAISKLLGGRTVSSFAYPYGYLDSDAKLAVRDCGYATARTVGGTGACPSCTPSERLAPPDPMQLRSSVSFVRTTPVSDGIAAIRNARRHGGGWIIFVFHDVCAGCSHMSITEEQLDELLRWTIQSGATVTTVRDATRLAPAALIPGPAPSLAPGQVPFGSLERAGKAELGRAYVADAEGPIDNREGSACWMRAGFGQNQASWNRVRESRSGAWAERLTMTRFQDGDRKLMLRMDRGSCAPPASAGDRYTLSAWYRSDAPVRLVMFVRREGDWQFLSASPQAPRSDGWREARWTAPALPDDVRQVSFGLALASVGTMVVDDFSMSPATTSWMNARTMMLAGVLGLVMLPLAWFTIGQGIRRRRAGRTT